MKFLGAMVVWFALVLGGCSSAPSSNPLPDPPPQGVGVLSLLGVHLEAIHVGPSEAAERYSIELADWPIDRALATRVTKQLRDRGYAARPVLPAEPSEGFHIASALFEGAGDVDIDKVVALGKKVRIATLVVIHRVPRNAGDPHQRFFEGAYGLYYRSLFGIRRSAVYTLVELQVIDVAGSREVARQRAKAWDGWDDQLPAWTPTFGDLTPQGQASVRQKVEKQLLERVHVAASELKL